MLILFFLFVSAMIKTQSSKEGGAQFITTTFRPELVEAASKCYGITFKNKVSTITKIGKKRARSIILAGQATDLGEGYGSRATTPVAAKAGRGKGQDEEEEEEEEEGEGKGVEG